jgi:DNA-binding transcriptional ArsR family regulator
VPVPDVTSVFERLGPPPGFEDTETLERLMADAAALAWRLAAGEGSAAADDEALLAELRAQGVATAGSIASSLGLNDETAQEALDRLYGAGAVMRMGEGTTARYRAA